MSLRGLSPLRQGVTDLIRVTLHVSIVAANNSTLPFFSQEICQARRALKVSEVGRAKPFPTATAGSGEATTGIQQYPWSELVLLFGECPVPFAGDGGTVLLRCAQ